MNAGIKTGAVLSHVEAIYRPEDRELAIGLFKALGCQIYDTETPSLAGQNYLSVHPDPSVRGLDNVIYLSQMTPEQSHFDTLLRARVDTDGELRAASANFQRLAKAKPFGMAHIALRYPDYPTLERVLNEIESRFTPEIHARAVLKIFRPGDTAEITWESIQAFVYTDIAVTGSTVLGQVFELSAYGPFSEVATPA